MEPVVVQSPRQVPHLVGGVALRRGQVDGSDQVGARTATDRRRRVAQPLGDVVDQGLPIPIEIAEQRFGEVKPIRATAASRSEEHTSELQSQSNLVCRLLLEKKKTTRTAPRTN